jgi:NADH:ubiquinone oxidoreductase subunit 5 (subunit L)/multisubunit Na+/H+ antiporter MnhA subunit
MAISGITGMMLAPMLIMLTIFMGAVWVVLKLLQAHFPEKTVDRPYTEVTRRKQKIGMLLSVVVCVISIALSLLFYFSQSHSSGSSVGLPFFPNAQLPSIVESLVILPPVLLILLVNGYVGWFYRLARQRRLPPQEPKQEAEGQQ